MKSCGLPISQSVIGGKATISHLRASLGHANGNTALEKARSTNCFYKPKQVALLAIKKTGPDL
ncbi:MAG: hypothetical protein Aurels2KO_19350 [Aureliella sp.]